MLWAWSISLCRRIYYFCIIYPLLLLHHLLRDFFLLWYLIGSGLHCSLFIEIFSIDTSYWNILSLGTSYWRWVGFKWWFWGHFYESITFFVFRIASVLRAWSIFSCRRIYYFCIIYPLSLLHHLIWDFLFFWYLIGSGSHCSLFIELFSLGSGSHCSLFIEFFSLDTSYWSILSLGASYWMRFVGTCREVSLLVSSRNFDKFLQILSLYTVFFLESSFSFTVFCLSVCFKIFIFFFYFKEINMHRLSYRVSDCQVGKLYEKACGFQGKQGKFQLQSSWESHQHFFIEITTWQGISLIF